MKKKSAPAGTVILAIALAVMYFTGGGQPAPTASPSIVPDVTFDAPINTNPGPASSGGKATNTSLAEIDHPKRTQARTGEFETPNKQPEQKEIPEPRLIGEHLVAGIRIVDRRNGAIIPIDELDLKPTLDRIARGERHSHRNDGSVYRNLNRKLPRHPEGYYREYVIPTPGINGPGPQRLILGKNEEIYYTWDHYDNFIVVTKGK